MTICPIALTAGCKNCPVFKVCPLKSVIGNYKKPDEEKSKQDAESAPSDQTKDQ